MYLLYRDGDGRDRAFELEASHERITIGRRGNCELRLGWDPGVSRVHAELTRLGGEWVVCDHGLSRNGTFVNRERVRGRRRLHDGDVLGVGETRLEFCVVDPTTTPATRAAGGSGAPVRVTPAQERVLTALCRPLHTGTFGAPASNRQIAAELVISVDTVKATLSRLFALYALDHLPQNHKRSALAMRVLTERPRA